MNSTGTTLTSYLANVQTQIVRSLLMIILIVANLNNVANIFVFSQKSLRFHTCAWYFIGVSVSHLLYLDVGCLTRVIAAWTQYDLSLISQLSSKIRIYFVFNDLTISRYFLCLISIDRWMITSRNVGIRQQSSPKIARPLIIGAILFLIIINIFIPVEYDIDINRGCASSTTPVYSLFDAIYNITLSLAPLSIVIIFSVLAVVNIRHISHQVSPTTTNQDILRRRERYHKKDIQFIKLSLVQVAGYIIFNVFHGYNTIYGVVTLNNIKTPDQRAIDGFCFGLGLNPHYTYTGITFFLYTLASVTFRKASMFFWKRWSKQLLRLLFHQPNRQNAVLR